MPRFKDYYREISRKEEARKANCVTCGRKGYRRSMLNKLAQIWMVCTNGIIASGVWITWVLS
jgi:hypothetical protein